MAYADVVCHAAGDGSIRAGGSNHDAHFVEIADGSRTPPDAGEQIAFGGMTYQWEDQRGSVLSEWAPKIMQESRRQGTCKTYNHPWQEWVGWCELWQKDLIQAPVESVANFLANKSQAGLEYRTLNVYWSVILAKHSLVQRLLVRQHLTLTELLKGVFSDMTPHLKYMIIRDVDTVLEWMRKQPEDKFLSLRELSLKVTMIMALTSAGHSSGLHKMKLSGKLDKGEKIKFHIGELTKGRRTDDRLLVMSFTQYEAEQKLWYSICEHNCRQRRK